MRSIGETHHQILLMDTNPNLSNDMDKEFYMDSVSSEFFAGWWREVCLIHLYSRYAAVYFSLISCLDIFSINAVSWYHTYFFLILLICDLLMDRSVVTFFSIGYFSFLFCKVLIFDYLMDRMVVI